MNVRIKKLWILTISISLLLIISFAQATEKEISSIKELGKYILPTGMKDRERLQALNEIYNPYSITFLKQYINPRDKVLELGCGLGLMSQEIVKMVGEQGCVLATDACVDQIAVAKGLVSDPDSAVLQFQVASAYDLSGIKGQYDVVYMRFLLMHLKEPKLVFPQVKSVLKPGGFIVIEEIAGGDTIRTEPIDLRINHMNIIAEVQQRRQQSCFDTGLTLPSMLEGDEFSNIHSQFVLAQLEECSQRRVYSLGLRNLRETFVREGEIEESVFDSMLQDMIKLEEDTSIKLFAHRIAQIAATLKGKVVNQGSSKS